MNNKRYRGLDLASVALSELRDHAKNSQCKLDGLFKRYDMPSHT